MKRKRHTPDQVIALLRDAEADLAAGLNVEQVCKKLGVSQQTYFRWKSQYGGAKAASMKRLKELEAENKRLKKAVADLTLEKQILKEGARGKLLTPARRRSAVKHVQRTLGTSERFSCSTVHQARSTQRYEPQKRSQVEALVQRMLELSGKHPRYGYRRIWSLLRREGFAVNRKRVHRLWRLNGLKVPQRRKKKRALGQGSNGCATKRAEHRNHTWAWDFIHDRTSNGRSLKWISVVDEFTREFLVLEVGRSQKATDVIEAISEAMKRQGAPRHIRSDNGPEFIAKALRKWLSRAKVETLYVEPGSPWQNGYAESFHAKLRDELLEQEMFGSVEEAKLLSRRWSWEYNHQRPHSALGYRTPAEYAAETQTLIAAGT
ncbi:MAG: IS3 family transposase [Planctomycetota bacterium]|nr:IS3 family transposase [Planctomycetota bacterium]